MKRYTSLWVAGIVLLCGLGTSADSLGKVPRRTVSSYINHPLYLEFKKTQLVIELKIAALSTRYLSKHPTMRGWKAKEKAISKELLHLKLWLRRGLPIHGHIQTLLKFRAQVEIAIAATSIRYGKKHIKMKVLYAKRKLLRKKIRAWSKRFYKAKGLPK